MAARTLAQIISELSPTFQAQTDSLQQQAGLIPEQIKSQEQGLNAQKDVAYEDIVNGARRRNMGFSGIPLGEQAKYAATTYAPALANLRQQGQQRAMSLQDAILGINERRDTLGNQIFQQEQDREFQAQEAEKQRQAALRQAQMAASPTFGGRGAPNPSGGTQGGGAVLPKVQKSDSGYNFFDAYGQPVNAAEYVQLYNRAGGTLSYRQLLQQMANDGDSNAKVALNYVGDDFKFGGAPSQYQGALSALGASGNYSQGSGGGGNLALGSGYKPGQYAALDKFVGRR